MKNNFEELISTLQISSLSSYNDNLDEISHILEKQNSELLSSFISQFYESILILEHWAWQLFSQQNSEQWINKSNYVEFFRILALFNKNLIFNHEDIETNIKASLIFPETIECINMIFEKFEKI
ncbi:unnamed protein product, partial [Rotaria sp. Silwood2]